MRGRKEDVSGHGGDNLRLRYKQDAHQKEKISTEHLEDKIMKKDTNKALNLSLDNSTYWLTRIILLRYIAFIYFVAFLVAYHQNTGLLGKNGLLPANQHLNNIAAHVKGDLWNKLLYCPTFLWFIDYENHLDWWLSALSLSGVFLSAIVILLGAANIPLMLILWLLYHSIVNIGQTWYSFGWESQLLETGFLGVFLCPLLSLRQIPRDTPTSRVVLWAFTWLICRIMIGAGLIKIRGDQCWRDLTCMNYHYETQPVPNPISYYMHQEPEMFHKFETLTNHFVELIAPFLLIITRRLRLVGASIQIFFQVVLIISGNLSFLNWLTITPCLASFDDASLSWMFSGARDATKWQVWKLQQEQKYNKIKLKWSNYVRRCLNIGLGLLLAYLSLPIVQNLLSKRQIMNTSFDPFRIVNTYGAFGSITKERTEVILQGTYDHPDNHTAVWHEYEFNCKPGNIQRRPCFISPYHYRLDWLMWFAAFQNYQHNNWLVHLTGKLLVNDELATSLIAYNPFEGKQPPKFIRGEHYRYVYTAMGSKAATNGSWWSRRKQGSYLPPVSLDSLTDYIKSNGWKVPRLPRGRRAKA